MTKLNGKCLKREMSVGGLRRPLVIEIDGQAQVVRMYEKGCRHKYSLLALTIFLLMIRQDGSD